MEPKFGLNILPLLVLLPIFGLWLWSDIWAARDAASRGKPGLLVALLVLFVGWPVGLLVWIALRPEHRPPPFDLNRFRVQ